MAEPTVRQTATLDEANAEGFLGTHVDVRDPDGYTLEAVAAGPDVTDPAYAEQQHNEHRPPDIDTLTDPAPKESASKSSGSSGSSGSSSSSKSSS